MVIMDSKCLILCIQSHYILNLLMSKAKDSLDHIAKRGVDTMQSGVNAVHSGVGAVSSAAGKLSNLVGKATSKVNKNSDEFSYVIVEDLPHEVKLWYMSVLVWLVHADDGYIDERELCEIQLLMTQIKCDAEVRKAIREKLEDPNRLAVETQIDLILNHEALTDSNMVAALQCSLMKDAIRVCRATSDGPAHAQGVICQLSEYLLLKQDQVEFIENACQQDEKILSGELSDSQIMDAAKAMAAQATAVGVPVAAVYLSGSVAGLSAAGITSGLAALGVGGLLGLSAMVTGIGVALIGGVVAYKGIRWALGGSERNRSSLREMMLQEVLRTHQRAIINLGEDMSHFGDRIVRLTQEMTYNREAIELLSREVALLSRSAKAITRLGDQANDIEHDLQETVEKASDEQKVPESS